VAVANEYVKSQLNSQSSEANVIEGDFFTFTPQSGGGGYDIGFDYTFLCALMPEMRAEWATSWHRILRPGGLLITLIFPVDENKEQTGPPWPVTPELYKELLVEKKGLFVLKSLEKVPDEQSHAKRAGKEYMAVWERK
jgi:methyl halide transferase